jgi:PAS domain S-box-containing protein
VHSQAARANELAKCSSVRCFNEDQQMSAKCDESVPDTLLARGRQALSTAQLQVLIEQASDGIFVADGDGRYTFVNEAGCRMLGCSREEVIGKTILDLIPSEDIDRLQDSKTQLLRGATQVAEWQLRRRDGSWLPVEVSAKILADGQWQAIVRDISERKAHQAQNEKLFRQLEDERRWLQAVLDALPIGVVLYRGERNALYNRHSEELLGMKLSPTGGSSQYANRILFGDGRPVPQSELVSTRVLRHQQTIVGEEFLIERPDHTRIPVLGSAAPIYDESGRMLGGVGVFQDVSERMLAEEKIREERQLLKGIFDILPVGVWVADRQGRIILSNRAGDQIWQGTRHVGPEQFGEYKAWWVETGKPIAPEEWGIVRAIRRGETSQSELLRIQCFDGSFKTVINWAAPIRAEDGAITGAIAVNEDVTSLQHTQEQLRVAVRDREDILAIVTHDLRNPLTALLMAADAMARETHSLAADEPLRLAIAGMRDTARRMSGLVDDLLAAAVTQGGHSMLKLASISVSTLLNEAAEARPLLAKQSLRLELRVEAGLPMLNIDSDRILRVLTNLLDNALKFTDPSGRILLSADAVAGGVRFAVANSGEPLPIENLKAMFQPFWQAARQDSRGAGLGLAICRSIVEAHGGTIWAEPAQGERVRVCFVLPRAPGLAT